MKNPFSRIVGSATALLLWALLASAQAETGTGRLVVDLSGMIDQSGSMVVELWQNDELWLKKRQPGAVFRSGAQPLNPGPIQVIFDDLPWGEYAITAYHDRNTNGRLDRGFLGMPKERVGFSNNVRPRLRAPRFDECAFAFQNPEQMISIEVAKLP